MVGISRIVEFKLLCRTDFIIRTCSLNHSPTAITNISCARFIGWDLSSLDFFGKLLMMSMMLKTSSVIVLIKHRSPKLCGIADYIQVVLKIVLKLLILGSCRYMRGKWGCGSWQNDSILRNLNQSALSSLFELWMVQCSQSPSVNAQ